MFDWIKSNQRLAGKRRRFKTYDATDTKRRDPETIGLVANEPDHELGCPSLSRNENILIFASSAGRKESLLVELKWRPSGEANKVTLISSLTFVDDQENVYDMGEQIETYEAQESLVKPNRIMQYGSDKARLKLCIMSPYRRLRLFFCGQLQKRNSSETVFFKLTSMIVPINQIYDFCDTFDEQLIRNSYQKFAESQGDQSNVPAIEEFVDQFVVFDTHEHKTRFYGEYSLVNHQNDTRIKQPIRMFGYHRRQFTELSLPASEVQNQFQRLHIYGILENGQSFHVGRNEFGSSAEPKPVVQFGHTTFEIYPHASAIDKEFEVLSPSALLNADGKMSDEFAIKVHGPRERDFEFSAKRRYNNMLGPMGFTSQWWFELNSDGILGFALVRLEAAHGVDSDELKAKIESSRSSHGQRASGAPAADEQPAKLLVCFGDKSCASSEVVGSKAASLARLSAAQSDAENFVVPKGCALTKAAHQVLVEANGSDLKTKVEKLQEFVATFFMDKPKGKLKTSDLEEKLRDQCKQLEDYVAEEVEFPAKIRAEVQQFLDQNSADPSVRFAVRSSSWGEDEADMSAAGQLTTVLNVEPTVEQLSRAIMRCYASKFSHENIEYKRQHGLPFDLPMSVVIQEMVQCDKAGVLFTCDPTSGDDSSMLITANYGLGESVVGAQADPDSIRVRVRATGEQSEATLEVADVQIGTKKVVVALEGGNAAAQDKSKCCLSDDEILRLARCAYKLKHSVSDSSECDIEWGFKTDGNNHNQLYLFQMRPVTGLETLTEEELINESNMPTQAEKFFYSRANVCEVTPYALKPLTLTCAVLTWRLCGVYLLKSILPQVEFVPQCTMEFYYEKYHGFFNLQNSFMFSMRTTNENKNLLQKTMEMGFFGHEVEDQLDIIEGSKRFTAPVNPYQGFKYNMLTFWLRHAPVMTVMKENKMLDNLRNKIRRKFSQQPKNQVEREARVRALMHQLTQVTSCGLKAWLNHIHIIMLGTRNNSILTMYLSQYIKDPLHLTQAVNNFLSIAPDVVSGQIPDRINRIATMIYSNGEQFTDQFLAMDNELALELLRSKKPLAKQFDEFIREFGHRCYNEFDLWQEAWRERPEDIVEMIKSNCKAIKHNGGVMDTKKRRSIDEIIDSLGVKMSYMERLTVKYIFAPRCQSTLMLREMTKNVLIKHADVEREVARMLADGLQSILRIPDSDLFYYVLLDELEPLINGPQPAIVTRAIRRRNLFRKHFQSAWKFDEIIRDLVPLHLKPSKALDEKIAGAAKLHGTPASGGKIEGKICLIKGFEEINKVVPGSILLTHSTDVAFSPIFPIVSGIITEVGGLISHGAVVAREYGLPCVIGIPDVTQILQDGEQIIMDADNGLIVRLSKQQEENAA